MESKNQKIVGISFTKQVFEELDKVRGDVPRSKYIVRLLEKDLENKSKSKQSQKYKEED